MALLDRMIDQTFANAAIDDTNARSSMAIGTLKAVNGEQARVIVLVDNGFAGLKLVALTMRALFIIDKHGGISSDHPIEEIVKITSGWGVLTITYEIAGDVEMHHRFNVADRHGANELVREFDALWQR